MTKFADWFAERVSDEVCKPRKNSAILSELYEESSFLLSNIKHHEKVEVDWNYLYAYMQAYKKMSEQQNEATVFESDLSKVVASDEKISKIINLVGTKGFACQDDIAAYLRVDKSVISKLLGKEEVTSLELFSVRKYGHKNYYFLSWRGEEYFKNNKSNDDASEFQKKIEFLEKQLKEKNEFIAELNSQNNSLAAVISEKNKESKDTLIKYAQLMLNSLDNGTDTKSKVYMVTDRLPTTCLNTDDESKKMADSLMFPDAPMSSDRYVVNALTSR